jgi:hypothetical protein
MIWFLLILFIFGLVMGLFHVPVWIVYSVVGVMLVIFMVRNPLLFGKDTEKMEAYLKKSKAPFYQFLYHFLQGDLSAAEQAMGKIRSKKSKRIAESMLLMERKQYGKAKELLQQMSGLKTKWYALSEIAIHENDPEAFEQHKAKLSDTYFLHMLNVDREVHNEKKEEAIALLDNMIPKLRGYKLLSAVQYRKQILEGRV